MQRDANRFSAARVDSTDLVGLAVGGGSTSLHGTLRVPRDASTGAFSGGNAQAAAAGAARDVILAPGLYALLHVGDGGGLAHAGAAVVAVGAGVAAGAAVVQVGLQVLAGVGRGAAEGRGGAGAGADGCCGGGCCGGG